jgi:pimeloyl-ACP methyl ester carboxylesterase
VGWALSLLLTHRAVLTEIQTPADFGLIFEEVPILAADGLRLRGWWIPSGGSDRAVIILHGHMGSMDMDVHRAPALHAAGFHVLLFDFRGHGRSDGRQITFGYLERRDLQGAVAFLRSRGVRRIGLLGFSLGGITATLSAPLCPEVAAVVNDGGPIRMRTAAAARGVEWGFPAWLASPMAWLTIAVTCVRLRANLFRYEAVHWVGRIAPRPILFIRGDRDQYCPDFDDLYAAAGQPKELWRVPEAGHVTLSSTVPEEHRQRVIAFFQKQL